MSMKADLLNPELGYFDEGENLTDPGLFKSVNRAFGDATALPPVAYRSKIFAELENEKLWTRGWIPIGLLQQIPNPGDLLPFTIGFHGVHIQRNKDGSISARFNRHQHGGCRFVPEQCRTGGQTKCSITSCNYTRDADVMAGNEDGDDTDLMYKFVGVNPDKLVSVKCETWGPFILINLDPECQPLSTELEGIPERIIQRLGIHTNIQGTKWLDFLSNWKHAGHVFARSFYELASGASFSWNGEGNVTPAYVMENVTLPARVSEVSGDNGPAEFCWLFPNLLIVVSETHTACVILQATAMGKSLHRVFLLDSDSSPAGGSGALFDAWVTTFREIGAEAEELQCISENWGSARLPGTSVDALPTEQSLAAYTLQKYLVSRLLEEHVYYWNAPIMDAGFRGPTR